MPIRETECYKASNLKYTIDFSIFLCVNFFLYLNIKIVCVCVWRESRRHRTQKYWTEKSPLFFVCFLVNAFPSAPPGFILYISLFFIIIIIIIMGNFFSLLLLFWRPFRPTMSVEPWLENNTTPPQKRKEWEGKKFKWKRRRKKWSRWQRRGP